MKDRFLAQFSIQKKPNPICEALSGDPSRTTSKSRGNGFLAVRGNRRHKVCALPGLSALSGTWLRECLRGLLSPSADVAVSMATFEALCPL